VSVYQAFAIDEPANRDAVRTAQLARDFQQIEWDDATADDCRQLVRLAVREDLEREHDWTTLALVPPERTGAADIVARQPGVVAGLATLPVVLLELGARLDVDLAAQDGDAVAAGARVATIRGNVRDMLTSERIVLNFLGRLMGIATLTRAFVAQTAGTACRVYDTRKTTPAWRRLEKYAVRCGGGHNHRTGLYDAVLIKDNHLAQFPGPHGEPGTAAAAVRQARQFLRDHVGERRLSDLLVEVEVDSLDQLVAVLAERPDIVLLDNMTIEQLAAAVEIRNSAAPGVELEASGGVTLDVLPAIAATGVDRVSVGGLTHSAKSLDIGLDYASG
jgi:nicotinate-nucleotide pyrophosphorylase (carboxylating)